VRVRLSLRMHGQHVDDVGPAVASLVAVAEQLRGDRVAVGPVVDQHITEEAHLGWANQWDLGKERVRGWVMVADWVRAMEMVKGRG
jgi:hypothetical protein